MPGKGKGSWDARRPSRIEKRALLLRVDLTPRITISTQSGRSGHEVTSFTVDGNSTIIIRNQLIRVADVSYTT